MISVIIPTLNEERTIEQVIRYCFSNSEVDEVIVIDDQSTDATAKLAKKAGAKVFLSSRLGKGTSMQEGVELAKNEILVFMDGDINPYPSRTISLLTEKLINDECDFVKANFGRNAGRVTELVARPLLGIFYPDLVKYNQPLGGMIAGKKIFFQQVNFLPDYGVDIGILIDMHRLNARIDEVNIGYIENKSKPWRGLAKMSREVANAIIIKAFQGNISPLMPQQDLITPSPQLNLE